MSSLARSAGYFSRSYSQDLRLVTTAWRWSALTVFLAIALTAPYYLNEKYIDLLDQSGIAILGALGLSILTGYAGQISLAHAGLFGIAGFAAGIGSSRLGLSFVPAILLAMLVGAFVGFVLGLPALRLRGLYLVLATLAFHFVAIFAITEYQSYLNKTVALAGLTLPYPSLGFTKLTTLGHWFYFLFVVDAIAVLYCINLVRTRPGRAWVAVRDRDLVAASLGVHVLRAKLAAFVFSSALASAAGALLVYYNGAVSSETYTFNLAITYLVMVIVGGLGSTTGAIFGAIFVTMSLRLITFAFESVGTSSASQTNYLIPGQGIVFGVIMLIFLVFEPRGLIGLWNRVRAYFELWPFRHRPLAERLR